EARIGARRDRVPQLRVRLHQRVHLPVRQVVPLIAQRIERLPRVGQELEPQLFVSQQSADDELNDFLRHGQNSSTHLPRNVRGTLLLKPPKYELARLPW